MKLNFDIVFCERLPLDLLLEQHAKTEEDAAIGLLKPCQGMMDFVNVTSHYIIEELKCSYYHDLKIREFLFLMRAYYDKRQIYNFFKPIYNADSAFLGDIYRHLDEVRTVRELSSRLGYSLSGFEKKFKKVFDSSPYQWMQEQRARKIYKEITFTKRTFTDISFDYDFSSPAHFNDFCKQYFQNTPGGLRKENKARTV